MTQSQQENADRELLKREARERDREIIWDESGASSGAAQAFRNSLLVGNVDLKKLKAIHKKKVDAEKALDDFMYQNRFDRNTIKEEEETA